MSELLSLNNISVSYGNIKALKDVSMHVEDGDIVSLIGANGAGKSTLLKAIVGLEPLQSGSIVYKGETLGELKNGKYLGIPTHKLITKGIALVPEGRHVFADLTIEENLEMGAYMLRDDRMITKKKEEMYDFFPILGARKKQKSRSLSGGEQQMLAVARALMSSPHLLLLDEPGLGLAPLVIQDIFSKIAVINKEEKVTVFLVEQNARMALKAANQGYVIENGKIVLADKASALLKNEQVRKAYLGE